MEATTYTLDPVNFFPLEVTLNIFKFLKGKELLNASLVSIDWYDIIANTPECMKKIELNVKCCSQLGPSPNDINRLAKGRRQYENLNISGCCHCIDAVDLLIGAPNKLWKKVTFHKISFNSSYQAFYYLACIEKSVEELVLSNIYIKDARFKPTAEQQNFAFLKLTNLIVSYISPFLFQALENVRNLEKFIVSNLSLEYEPLTALKNLLESNEKLKVLKIFGGIFDQIMSRNIAPDLKFTLKELAVANRHLNTEYYDTIQDNFIALLKSQKSLESVNLGNWSGVEVLRQVYRLPKLKRLTLTGLELAEYHVCWDSLELSTNNSVVELIVHSSASDFPMLFRVIKVISTAVPKLTVLKIPTMIPTDQYILHHVSATHKELQSLTVLTLKVIDVIDKTFFKSLKHLSFRSCDAALVKRTMEKAEADLAPFEVLLKSRFTRNLENYPQ